MAFRYTVCAEHWEAFADATLANSLWLIEPTTTSDAEGGLSYRFKNKLFGLYISYNPNDAYKATGNVSFLPGQTDIWKWSESTVESKFVNGATVSAAFGAERDSVVYLAENSDGTIAAVKEAAKNNYAGKGVVLTPKTAGRVFLGVDDLNSMLGMQDFATGKLQLSFNPETTGENLFTKNEYRAVPAAGENSYSQAHLAQAQAWEKYWTNEVNEYKAALVGENNYKRFNGKFPLLIKFIDAQQDLSIQVHPNDELAMKRHNSMGKTEMWYVIGNDEGKAHLRSGLSKQITPEEYARRIADNTICDVLADYAVQPGDVFFLPAGRIHSIGAGCFIAEIQQTSNITYRIYDFNRKDKNGNTRELHTELSKDAIDYTVSADYRTHYTPKQNEPVELVSCPYFTTTVYDLTEPMEMDYSELDSFVIYICMEGACSITDNEGNQVELQAGESVLFPATTESLSVKANGHVKFLETYV